MTNNTIPKIYLLWENVECQREPDIFLFTSIKSLCKSLIKRGVYDTNESIRDCIERNGKHLSIFGKKIEYKRCSLDISPMDIFYKDNRNAGIIFETMSINYCEEEGAPLKSLKFDIYQEPLKKNTYLVYFYFKTGVDKNLNDVYKTKSYTLFKVPETIDHILEDLQNIEDIIS